MVKVHRHTDGTVDVLFTSPDVQVSIVGATPDEFSDEMPAASVTDAPASPPDSPAEPSPAAASEEAAPAAEADAGKAPVEEPAASSEAPSAAAFRCTQCGATFAEPTTCSNNHPATEAVMAPVATDAPPPVLAIDAGAAAATGSAPSWPDQPQS